MIPPALGEAQTLGRLRDWPVPEAPDEDGQASRVTLVDVRVLPVFVSTAMLLSE